MVAARRGGTALRRLTKRSQFLRAARGQRASRRGFTLQATGSTDEVPGVGFTVTKKVGNAPERNRIRRRLREVARTCAERFAPQHDYVLIGRREALSLRFDVLVIELDAALRRVDQTSRSSETKADDA